MLLLRDVTYRIAGRTLLDKANLTIPAGYRVGLVGPNGTGKSTLFKLIVGELELDGGDVEIISGTQIGMVRQDLPDDDTTLIDVVLAADTERAALFKEAETAEDPQRIADIYTRLEDISAYDAPARAAVILAGLGFDDAAQNSPISDFSGGWRMRVALAAALFRKPDLLLLDEPTNHLDFEAIIWLENFMMNYEHTLIVISHDREILNKTVTHIAHLDQLKLTMYTGTYDEFETRRAQKMLNQQALHAKQQKQKQHMMAFVARFGASASKASQAQSRLKMIEKMDLVDAIIADRVMAFTFPTPDELPPPIIALRNVDIGYAEGKPVLKDISLNVTMTDRIALLGANGNGKSTLIKLLSGKLDALKGEVFRNGKLRVGYFAQHQAEELDLSTTPYLLFRRELPDTPEPKIRAMLGKFGFDRQKADTLIENLSGGEKARLLFCLMSHDAPHIMLLDEPTNHLDIDARQALIQALNGYEGCVIIVSHDPHIVESVADQLWLVKDGTCKPYDGDLEAYRKLIIEQRRRERSEAKKSSKKDKESGSGTYKQLQKIEKEVARLTRDKDRLENEMTRAEVVNSPDKMAKLMGEHDRLKKKLEEAEEQWLMLQETSEG